MDAAISLQCRLIIKLYACKHVQGVRVVKSSQLPTNIILKMLRASYYKTFFECPVEPCVYPCGLSYLLYWTM